MTISNTEYLGVNLSSVPPMGSKHRQMLDLYMSGEVVQEDILCDKFGRNFRGIFQALRGDKYCHWRFVDIQDENGIIEARKIDSRHLSQDPILDSLARAERRKELKADSFKEAVAGANRVKPSYDEYMEASDFLNELHINNGLEMKQPEVHTQNRSG
tara:strand:+ start:1862 stop:2332 length:471 start_codon:yes stop_codon:yes gene_type:complete